MDAYHLQSYSRLWPQSTNDSIGVIEVVATRIDAYDFGNHSRGATLKSVDLQLRSCTYKSALAVPQRRLHENK
jgi:hypothetical protein